MGIYLEGMREDIERLDRKQDEGLRRLDNKIDAYIGTHADAHRVLDAEVRSHDDWQKKREVYEGLMRWVLGSNLAVIVGLIITVVVFVR